MKIGFVNLYFGPEIGGAERNCYYLAKELAKKHEVHVFCSGLVDKDEVVEGIHVHRCKEWIRLSFYVAFYPSIVRKLLKYKLDIVHLHGIGFIQHDIAVSKLKKKNPLVKLVCTPHGPFMVLKRYGLFGKWFKKFYTKKVKKAMKSYDAVIKVNPYQDKWMVKEYGVDVGKIKYLPNGLDKGSFGSLNKMVVDRIVKKYDLDGKYVISYLGRVQEYKGVGDVIKALPFVKKVCPQIMFVAMGENKWDKERLLKLVKKLRVEDNVVLTGKVSEEEKFAVLDVSKVFIFPSEWEAFGIVVLEAMARGNAVISAKSEGGRYLVEEGKNGFLFDYGDFKGLGEGVVKLIKDENLRKRMVSENFGKSERFLWKDIAKNLEKIYEDVL